MVHTAIAIRRMSILTLWDRAAPLHGVRKATSVLIPETAKQEEKCPGVIEINYSAANPVKDPPCQLK